MDIKQLKYVIEVAGSSSMREAASRLYISQPALSASISELEQTLGILIFERSNKGISLTLEGREFLTYAKRAVGQYEILEDRYFSKDSDKEKFSVSTQHYNFAINAFAEVIKKIDPDRYVFSIHETRTSEVLEDVRTFKSEIGIVSFSRESEQMMKKLFKEYALEFTPLMRRQTYAYLWKDHKFASRKIVSLEQLKPYPCITFDQSGDDNYYISEEAMSDYDFDRMVKSDDRATTLELMAKLQGYSVGCGMLSDKDAVIEGIVSVKLQEEDPLTIGYITRRGSSLSIYGKAYLQELLKHKEDM